MEQRNDLKHLGIIMDGNRRWAKSHSFQSVVEGHRIGTNRFIDVCSWCVDENIPYLTVFAFSTENWNRSEEEVKGIFRLMEHFFLTEIDTCIAKGMRLRIVGDLSKLSESSQKVVRDAEEKTKHCAKLNAQIAVSYGGRDEILRAVKKLYKEKHGSPEFFENLTEETFENYLDTAGLPCPSIDLIIRTGADGRKRTSGFFPWQSVYAELYFLDTLWPDFSRADLARALEWYRSVVRNKGR